MTPPQGAGVVSDDPLVSWCDGATKKSVVDFVARVTEAGGTDYVPPEERIATFDNDGTLWSERPYPFQVAFALDRVKAMAPQHPEWQEKEPFKSALAGDLKGMLSGGYHALIAIAAATHSGMTTDEFEAEVRKWVATTRHPKTNKLFTEMVFQPMLVGHLSLGQRLQDLHCLGRWYRIHAGLCRSDLRRTPRADYRQQR